MRLKLTILLASLSCVVYCQKYAPVGVANAYTLTEADGYPGINYFNGFEYTSSGKVYAKDFFGTFHITGNNFIKYIPSLKNIANNTSVTIISGNEVWLSDGAGKISIIRNDSLYKTYEPPGKNTLIIDTKLAKKFFAILVGTDFIILYEFKNYAWHIVNKVAISDGIKRENIRSAVFNGEDIVFQVTQPNNTLKIYKLKFSDSRLQHIITIHDFDKSFNLYPSFFDKNLQENNLLKKKLSAFLQHRTRLSLKPGWFGKYFMDLYPNGDFVFKSAKGQYEYLRLDNNQINPMTTLFETKNKVINIRKNNAYPYITVLTENKPLRIFPYIIKYPRIYENDNSNSIVTLAQNNKGQIWAGSYQNQLSIIDDPLKTDYKSKITDLKSQPYSFMNTSLFYNDKLYLVGETENGGLLRYNSNGEIRKLLPQMFTGYYLYLATKGNSVYYASADEDHGYPIYFCKAEEIEKPFINWEKLDTTNGIAPFGMASITEDTLGRIWMGHPKKGFAVYHPETNKGKSYLTSNEETPIGFISSTTDSRGTVWMGSDNHGLWYYNEYRKAPAPENIHLINHPLLNAVKRITSMAIYNDWLVLGCYDRICLLNLDSFYQKRKIILRYLNPQEAGFTGITEQNTMLVSQRDSSLWFSTSDMLYRWDMKTWLQLPKYKVNVATYLDHDSSKTKMGNKKLFKLPAAVHGFDINFEYISPDCLPRYTRTALQRKGDSLALSEPGIKSHFVYKNLSNGHYTFYLEIFEQDGTTIRYEYPFIIQKYWWENWWFWTIVSLLFLLPFVLWIDTLRKKVLQEKKISQMNLVTLSSQFRPHFILNALNSIGADLKNNPEAESILSRLGESINLIFSYAQQQKLTHSLKDEWTLLQNVIEIHRIIYLPELNMSVFQEELLEQFKDIELPLGILEIHMENALLHGLRNKKAPPYNLSLGINEDTDNLYFTITDNGIGRQEAMTIDSYRKNGVGTKNLNSIIVSLNKHNKNKINITYKDVQEADNSGTIVKITIPKNYFYKY